MVLKDNEKDATAHDKKKRVAAATGTLHLGQLGASLTCPLGETVSAFSLGPVLLLILKLLLPVSFSHYLPR